MTIELSTEIAVEITKLLAPIVFNVASKAAQNLANQSKELANDLSQSMLKAIENS